MTAVVVLLVVVVAVLCVLVAGLLRAYAAVLARLHQLDGGAAAAQPAPFRTAAAIPEPVLHTVGRREDWTAAHDVTGVTLAGELAHVRTVEVEHDTVLAFLSSGCTGCAPFWDELHGEPALAGRLVVVAKDAEHESPSELARLAPPGIDLLLSSQAWSDYAVPGSPFVVVVDGVSGRVKGHGTGRSLHQVAGLVNQAGRDTRGGKPRSDRERESAVDAELLAAGITPGHPTLFGRA